MLKSNIFKKTVTILIGIGLVVLSVNTSLADYPKRRITLVHPWKAGMPAHVAAQIMAEKMGKILGEKIVIVVLPGGTGVKAVKQVLSKRADGYTIMNMYGAPAATVPMVRKVKYDAVRDFIPIGGPVSAVESIVVRKDEKRFRTFKELIEYGKKNPGLKYGGPRNALPHLSITILLKSQGVKCKMIPYQGSAPAMKDLLAGALDFAFPNGGGYLTYKEDIHVLATLTENQSSLVPAAPPVTDSYDVPIAVGWNYWAVKKGTPPEAVKVLRDAVAQVFKDPSYGKKLNEIGWELAGRPAEAYEQLIKDTQSVLKAGVAASKWEAKLTF